MIEPHELMNGLRRSVKHSEPVVQYSDPFKVLISTVLSQRTRDENTQKASEKLFSELKDPESIANAKLQDIEKLIKQSGFYRVKAKRIQEISKDILARFRGKTPDNMEELLTLSGVGRKTANCVLVYGFRKQAIPVDVHVHRISNRMGIVKTDTPEKTESKLIKIIPKEYWIEINHLMVLFGRQTCLPRNPKCHVCIFNTKCDYGMKLMAK